MQVKFLKSQIAAGFIIDNEYGADLRNCYVLQANLATQQLHSVLGGSQDITTQVCCSEL